MKRQELYDDMFGSWMVNRERDIAHLDASINYVSEVIGSLFGNHLYKLIFKDIRNAVPLYISKRIIEIAIDVMVAEKSLTESSYISNYRGKGKPQKAWTK